MPNPAQEPEFIITLVFSWSTKCATSRIRDRGLHTGLLWEAYQHLEKQVQEHILVLLALHMQEQTTTFTPRSKIKIAGDKLTRATKLPPDKLLGHTDVRSKDGLSHSAWVPLRMLSATKAGIPIRELAREAIQELNHPRGDRFEA